MGFDCFAIDFLVIVVGVVDVMAILHHFLIVCSCWDAGTLHKFTGGRSRIVGSRNVGSRNVGSRN